MNVLKNGVAVFLGSLSVVSMSEWRSGVIGAIQKLGFRLQALFAVPNSGGTHRLYAVLGNDGTGHMALWVTDVERAYRSLSAEIPQAFVFEKELHENHGIIPEDHPRMNPLRKPLAVSKLFSMSGIENHEVGVGPVHAGVIEPGHFRFQCHGEDVYHLEITLGYQHRGVESALKGGPGPRTISYMETAAGDTSIGHATAYAMNIEALNAASVSLRAQYIRACLLELERLANHTGDLGALAGDVAFLPTASFCGRLRGDFLNFTANICGNRLGRGGVVPGGVRFDIPPAMADSLRERIRTSYDDVCGAVSLLWNRPTVMGRFEQTGFVSKKACIDLGLVGPAARACGLLRDVRMNYPTEVYRQHPIHATTCASGDVHARALVRWQEIQASVMLLFELLDELPQGECRTPVGPLAPDSLCVSLVEGWRGEICHVAVTDSGGNFSVYKIIDPSFHNWLGLEMALRHQQISDFPLCNKSFNLSYCGHDL